MAVSKRLNMPLSVEGHANLRRLQDILSSIKGYKIPMRIITELAIERWLEEEKAARSE